MDIIYVNDDYFFIQLAVSIKSLLENNSDIEWNIHFINTGMSIEHVEYINKICQRYGARLCVYDSVMILERIKSIGIKAPTDGNNLSTLVRLFMFEILPQYISYAIYIDTDTMVSGKISDLLKEEFSECIMAVRDANYDFYTNSLQDRGVEKYFNAGMMVVNLNKMRNLLLNIDVYSLIEKRFRFVDQDILNLLCKDDVKYITPEYNASSKYRMVSPENLRKWIGNQNIDIYSDIELKSARKNPKIIHFTTSLLGRPWEVNSMDPDTKRWMRVYESLEPTKVIMKSRQLSKSNKIGRFIYKLTPGWLFVYIDRKFAYKKYYEETMMEVGNG